MTSAALVDLRNRIATNTLTPSQQAALTAALDQIAPTFPSPDELSNSIPSFEEPLSREWFASLYSISIVGGPPLPPLIDSVTATPPISAVTLGSAVTVGFLGSADLTPAGLVQAISGPSPIVVAPQIVEWAQGTVAPILTQAQQTNAAAPQPLTLGPQPPGPAPTSAANGTPAPLTLLLPVPLAGGAESYLNLHRASGGSDLNVGPLTALPTATGIWCGVVPGVSNYNFLFGPTLGFLNYNINTTGGSGLHQFFADTTTSLFVTGKTPGGGQGTNLTSNNFAFGGGVGVAAMTEATTEPTANPTLKTVFWSFGNGAFKTRSKNGFRTNLAAVGQGAAVTQARLVDADSGVATTVTSAAPTPILTYATLSDKAGWITTRLVSRATTAGVGIAVGDATMSTYVLGYKNVGGVVTLSNAGITLVGAAQTTAAALTSVLTAAAVGATVVISVTNTNLCTIDSQCDITPDIC